MEFLANNWLYILFAGLMFYMMTKGGGCCGGHSHQAQSNEDHAHGGGCCGGGSKHDHGEQTNQIDTVKDPICGMTVDTNTAIKQVVNGQAYYFCSESCRKEFVEKYE